MKIISVVGNRPQFIKVKPIADVLKRKKGIRHVLVHTGQHYDYEMSKIFFDELKIPQPDYNLMVGSHTQGKQTALMLERIEKVLLKEEPDIVMVYGDTNSTLAGALATVKLDIPVAHVEAGLRSFRQDMPEEVNRVLTDRMSSILFCPTKAAVENLKKEGITKGVYLVGDVMYDIFRKSQPLLEKRKILQELNLKPREYLLLTIHRKESTDNLKNLRSIICALAKTKEKIVFPVHPRTRKVLIKIESIRQQKLGNFLLLKPVSYLDMLVLEKNARKILTDSGGVQKEAQWSVVPCITLRNETEWVETVENKCNVLTGMNINQIIREVNRKPVVFSSSFTESVYDDGCCAAQIIRFLERYIYSCRKILNK